MERIIYTTLIAIAILVALVFIAIQPVEVLSTLIGCFGLGVVWLVASTIYDAITGEI